MSKATQIKQNQSYTASDPQTDLPTKETAQEQKLAPIQSDSVIQIESAEAFVFLRR